ncbi:XRE family transcriptional regulator [Thiopseudomonas alkaliphila]|uniref:HTH-type transcriptional regulator MetR n=1 Tax=Thiopseudomonas alkaliphila TaxID=1697053 RepID=A0A0K1XC39_9GAMM|nr:transcriptional regulator MetR [Thiopseudomonas alkaliphila]AKX49749.1 XRE family transcriptional regulator [Thiopseudomonas alkaliphila]AKX50473.1 XRE family transcriptional regulator [Thiopseudomonas alkaliphila]AKX52360.1 XRE family transcriptional regulator [Thiopseudomonas alkaliphila]AKX56809.1 XRE family transcriptional regulator [Thiopseudomonas alkaliphila]AKX58950.1 XRE family transcriptional regulator [Thiopseudomonas alkaliphila]
MLEIRHLKTLQALKEAGSLVEAAERLHLTQSALSHQFKELEERLETSLFVRKTKPVRFTSAGLRLLKLANEVLPLMRAAERDLARLIGGTAGRLHMAIECHSCFQWLMPTIDQFRDAWPEVELDLASGFSFAPLPALARGDLDLVVTSDPMDISGLSYIPLFTYEPLLAVANQHPLAQKSFIEPNDLADQTLITYPVDRDRLDIFTQFLDKADIEPLAIRTSELTVMMMQLVASGRGVCCLPNWALHEYSSKGYVKAIKLGAKGLTSTLYAAIRSDMLDTPFMQDFLLTAKDTSFTTLAGVCAAKD